MTKAPSGHNGISYRHVDSITVDDHPPYVSPQEINPKANTQWVLTDLINMAQFLEPYVSGDGDKYKPPVIKKLTDHLNERVVLGGFKKSAGVKQKLTDVLAIYKGVNYLKTRSGGTWDDDFGANVITQTEDEVWASLV
ncbi:hypothetical protein B0H17DRAFT_959090, partial [Mycena rosella]